MKKIIFGILFISGISFASLSSASVMSISVSHAYPVQGDTIRIMVSGSASAPKTATLGDETADFFSYGGKYVAAVGLKVTAQTGWRKITIQFMDGATRAKWIDVLKKKITVETFTVPSKIGMTPTELVQGLNNENAALDKILNTVTPQSYITGAFGLPLLNNTHITDWYGILRKMGSQEFWHLGTDFASPSGSAVGAMQGGIVRFATSTISYGNMVVVDHGEGIYSMYLHLSKILTTVGQQVKKGTVIGLVGDTGLSTGSHLHISIKVNGVSVDPLRFVKVF
jgi:murein DD-endopeptidase MepM/ murein hydrolase activator NlpD